MKSLSSAVSYSIWIWKKYPLYKQCANNQLWCTDFNLYYCCADNIEVAYLKTLTKDDIIQFYKVS